MVWFPEKIGLVRRYDVYHLDEFKVITRKYPVDVFVKSRNPEGTKAFLKPALQHHTLGIGHPDAEFFLYESR